MSFEQYVQIIEDARKAGCRQIQFIGGEPTLHPKIKELIAFAATKDFDLIEIYSNLTSISTELFTAIKQHGVHLATSVYSFRPAAHDSITKRSGSFEKTIRNAQKAVGMGIPLRAAVVIMEQNAEDVEPTIEFLKELGITNVGTDRAREFGRASSANPPCMSELCGNCAGPTLCVTADGVYSPCIMARSFGVGTVNDTLEDVLYSEKLRRIREDIYQETTGRQQVTAYCNPERPNPCGPDRGNCQPCSPNGSCGPNICQPHRNK